MPTSSMKLACGVEYIGTHYCGWQSQKDYIAIQDYIEKAITKSSLYPLCASGLDPFHMNTNNSSISLLERTMQAFSLK